MYEKLVSNHHYESKVVCFKILCGWITTEYRKFGVIIKFCHPNVGKFVSIGPYRYRGCFLLSDPVHGNATRWRISCVEETFVEKWLREVIGVSFSFFGLSNILFTDGVQYSSQKSNNKNCMNWFPHRLFNLSRLFLFLFPWCQLCSTYIL